MLRFVGGPLIALASAACLTGCPGPAPADGGDVTASDAVDTAPPRPDTSPGDAVDVPTTDAPDVTSPDVTTPDASDGGAGVVRIRVAHLSPNAPPVDFCIKPRAAADYPAAPTLQGLGVTAGIRYTQVTRYLEVPPGAYNVRIVAAGSANCATPLLPALADIATLPALDAGTTATVGATGLVGGTPGFALTPWVDSADAPAAGNFKIRFLHTAPGIPAVDVGVLGAADAFTALFTNVAFPNAAAAMGGYVSAPAVMGATLAARLNGTTPPNRAAYPLVLEGVDLPAGANVTAFAIGQNTDTVPLAALVCNDSAAPMGALTACSVLPARAFIRVAHLSPDAPAVDVCIRAGASGPFTGPVFESVGLAVGAAFPSVTRYLAVPPGAYTVRIVAPTATNCDTPLAGLPDYTLPMLSAGQWATAAAVGLVGSTPASFTVRAYVDTHDVPAAGRIHLRFVHASPAPTPAVDVGTVSGATFTPIWSNVAFPNAGAATGSDPNGFLPTAPLAGVTLAARATGTTTTALTIPGVSIEAFSVRSIFAIGELAGTGERRLSAFICDDRAAATAGVAACTRAP